MAKEGIKEQPRHVSPPSALERLRFALLREGPRLPGGRYVGMETAPILPWPHQAVIARRIVADWPYSYLLCDEVGLGKTIEAGLVIRSLYLAGFVRRVLISPPAHLTRQWQREMASKFFLPFGRALTGRPVEHEYLLPHSETRAAGGLYDPDLVIVSTGLLARRQRQRELRRTRRFDVALLDEAQAVRRHNPTEGAAAAPRYGQLYRTIQTVLRPRSRCLLLLTATPMQLDPVEVHDLIHLTDRVGPFHEDPGLFNAYYTLIGRLARTEELHPLEWQCLRRAVRSVQREDPRLWTFVQTAMIEPAARPAVEEWLATGARPPTDQSAAIKRLAFAAAPLSRVMFRHTRRLLEVYRDRGELKAPLATRVVLPLQPIPFTDGEGRLYGELEVYCRDLVRQLGQGVGRHRAHALGFFSSFLRLRFASSLHAIGETLRRRLEHVQATRAQLRLATSADLDLDESMLASVLEEEEDDREIVSLLLRHRTGTDLAWEEERLSQMRTHLDAIAGPSSKMVRLLEKIAERRLPDGRYRQTVIFTRFYDTLTDIVAQLQDFDDAMLLATYSGRGAMWRDPVTARMVVVEREAITQRFLRGAIDVLVCTDAAAEGLNLQTADMLINFDLPWNPMTVEQRIGRLDRIGQTHAVVQVCNLCYPGSAEEIVYGRLLERLTEAGYVVGTQQLSLLPVTPEEFRALAEGELSADELTAIALQRARLAEQRAAGMETPASELYESYRRLEQSVACRAPVDLDAVWRTLSGSDYLRAAGCVPLPDGEYQALRVRNVAGIVDGTVLTVSRRACEEGIPALNGTLRFATYGEPAFEALLDHVITFPLPSCIRRLRSVSADAGIETVAYAVACRSRSGAPEIRLVTAWSDTADLSIDEKARLTDADIGHLQDQLHRMARIELDPIRTVTSIEALNRRAGRSQLLLDYLIARSLLVTRQRLRIGCERFWDELAAMQRQFEHRQVIRVPQIPARFGRRLKGLFFEAVLPAEGAEGYIDAPRMLLLSALDAVGRLADGVHGPRAELTVAAVLRRLEQAIAAHT